MAWKETGTSRESCSDETSSVFDEDRTKRLFDACDANGDGYIDSRDLATICEDLNLVGCIESLMRELGADEEGKISYGQFLETQKSLRPKIKAIRHSPTDSHMYASACSGKCDCWEFDSGARDLHSERNTLHRIVDDNSGGGGGGGANPENLLQLANKLHLAALASLQAEISELTERLYAVTDERDLLEDYLKRLKVNPKNAIVQKYEEQLTELHSVIAVLRNKIEEQRSCMIIEEDEMASKSDCDLRNRVDESTSPPPHKVQNVAISVSMKDDNLKNLELQNKTQKEQILKLKGDLKHTKICLNDAYEYIQVLENKVKNFDLKINSAPKSPEQKYKGCCEPSSPPPVPKVAERVKVQKVDQPIVTGKDLVNVGVSHTEVAEHLVSKVQNDCNAQELSLQEKRQIELQAEKSRAKEEYLRAQNALLHASFEEMKSNCERLYLLLGKYESSAIALKLIVDTCYELISDYEQLVQLLMNHRRRDATVSKEEKDVRSSIASLKKQWAKLQPTVIELESYQNIELHGKNKPSAFERKVLDLETAVLIQELTEIRKENAKLKLTIYEMNKQFDIMEKKVLTLEDKLKVNDTVSTNVNNNNNNAVLKKKICAANSNPSEKLKDASSNSENVIQDLQESHRHDDHLRKINV